MKHCCDCRPLKPHVPTRWMQSRRLGPYREGDRVVVRWPLDTIMVGFLWWTPVSGWTLVGDDGSRSSPILESEVEGLDILVTE